MAEKPYDLVVIGSGPAGQKAAIAAAKLHKRVAVIDRRGMLGGASLHSGTIPSKTLREAVLYLSGFRQRPFYGKDYTLKDNVSLEDLEFRVGTVMQRELGIVKNQLRRNGVDVVEGTARFHDDHAVEVRCASETTTIETARVLIAAGSRPARTPEVPIDGDRIFDSDLGSRGALYKDLVVVGAGVIGLEYASMFAALGVRVTLVDQRASVLEFVDEEIVETLCYHLRQLGVVFRLGESLQSVERTADGAIDARLVSGKRLRAEALLYTVGRRANTDGLQLEAVGLKPDERGRIKVNRYFQTEKPHIYASGDVIGFPALASTSMEQGRLASCHMFGLPCESAPELLPYGIYTIPEISMVGRTEQQLTKERIPYEVGIARYEELAKGQILGAESGLLKILFAPEDRRILGVHIIGENAAELVHLGQTAIALGGTLDTFRDLVFNYPTLAEAYKVAALNGLNKLAA